MKKLNTFKNKIISSITVLTVLFSLNSCETLELEILESPNALTPASSDIDFYLNAMQLNMGSLFSGVKDEGMQLTRMTHLYGPFYENAYATTQMSGPWNVSYSDIFTDFSNMVPRAEEKGWETHIGIAKFIKAYAMITLVDYLGDVPYSQAALGVENLNPGVDSGASIYDAALALIQEAKNHFSVPAQSPSNDLFYGGDRAKWTRATNTLELKLRLQRRNAADSNDAAAINSLISNASSGLIVSKAQDFQFKYGTLNASPDSRHPQFVDDYELAADVLYYMSNAYMAEFVAQKDVTDVRANYYFYRQDGDVSNNDDNEIPCGNERRPDHYSLSEIFCYIGYNDVTPSLSTSNGYWGRDHGDDDGIPPDGGLRTAPGLYPIGGQFDDGSFTATSGNQMGLKGAGIQPILLSSYTHFMIAEWNLVNGNTEVARQFLASGLAESFSKVTGFAAEMGNAAAVEFRSSASISETEFLGSLQANIDAYIDYVAGTGATSLWNTTNDKMGLLVQEYFLALFGNGVEAYNTFRRTDKPSDLQPLLKTANNDMIQSFFYPRTEVDNNNQLNQKSDHLQKVFWDN
ncbi:MAG: SusD/RagB family nutrient-binding outer membrane lipoprotein [Bacteroidetes bacterium]|nr:SusD/RagB family nutrient-binding outer membrane lipoprotein [Bacteroidota bacterium]